MPLAFGQLAGQAHQVALRAFVLALLDGDPGLDLVDLRLGLGNGEAQFTVVEADQFLTGQHQAAGGEPVIERDDRAANLGAHH